MNNQSLEKSADIKDKFEVLQMSVKDKLTDAENQRADIKEIGNLIIPSIMTIITFVVGILLNILYYWISAAFLLMLVWLAIFIVILMKSPKTIFEPNLLRKNYLSFAKTNASATYSLVVIYIIALIPLILLLTNLIPVVNAFNPILPTIAVVLVIISGILTPSFVLRMTASPIFQEFYKLYKVSGEHRSGNYDLWKKEPEKLRNANKKMGAFIFLFILGVGVLFVITFSESLKLIGNIPILLFFLAMELLASFYLQKYFSASDAKKELWDTIDNLTKLNDKLHKLSIDNNYTETYYSALKKQFLLAKKYDIGINNIFKFISTYNFTMNEDYYENTYLNKDDNMVDNGNKSESQSIQPTQ